jgi:hypothetical protein
MKKVGTARAVVFSGELCGETKCGNGREHLASAEVWHLTPLSTHVRLTPAVNVSLNRTIIELAAVGKVRGEVLPCLLRLCVRVPRERINGSECYEIVGVWRDQQPQVAA